MFPENEVILKFRELDKRFVYYFFKIQLFNIQPFLQRFYFSFQSCLTFNDF